MTRTRVLTECAIMLSLAFVLSMIKLYQAPLGGEVTLFGMVPIFIICFKYGFKRGLFTSLCFALVMLLTGMGTISYVPTLKGVVLCIFFDYIFAFGSISIAGLFKNETLKTGRVVMGVLAVCLVRLASHIISGAVVWYEITRAGDWNEAVHKMGMWAYSLMYNAQYMIPEILITLIAVPVIIRIIKQVNGNKISA